jgi:phage terminase large subunit-like protein
LPINRLVAGTEHELGERPEDSTRGAPDADSLGLVWRAVEAACGGSIEERSIALVALARDLRRIGEARLALSVLDITWSLAPSPETQRSAYACAIEVHCDLRQHDRARSIEREQARRSIDADFARAALRLFTELATGTGEDEANGFAEMYSAILAGAPDELPVEP